MPRRPPWAFTGARRRLSDFGEITDADDVPVGQPEPPSPVEDTQLELPDLTATRQDINNLNDVAASWLYDMSLSIPLHVEGQIEEMIMSLATTHDVGIGQGDHLKLDFIDIGRTDFNAMARREVFIRLPPEGNEEGMVGKLMKGMYGTRDATQSWEAEYRELMMTSEFNQC